MSELITSGVIARHSSEHAEHFTPNAIVEAARLSLGGWIDLDPASCESANERVKAKRFFDMGDNGFIKEWRGTILLNPPGGKCDVNGRSLIKLPKPDSGYKYADTGERYTASSQSSAKSWWFRLAEEFASGRVSHAVFVAFSVELLQSTQVDTPKGLTIPLQHSLCFPSRRVSYVLEDGSIGGSPPHASCIVMLSSDDEGRGRFITHFSPIGHVILQARSR